eukprot:TRINITY_DN2069_c0_g1_i2.p1 TRINITY_DN2069_c0_g1~~TRINITY_DN2069_c0_g1_i2.p1  ORF type:complete len:435 (+),score=109.81 TRINITY_DN2069_c0_g1_i2:37-1305(+)
MGIVCLNPKMKRAGNGWPSTTPITLANNNIVEALSPPYPLEDNESILDDLDQLRRPGSNNALAPQYAPQYAPNKVADRPSVTMGRQVMAPSNQITRPSPAPPPQTLRQRPTNIDNTIRSRPIDDNSLSTRVRFLESELKRMEAEVRRAQNEEERAKQELDEARQMKEESSQEIEALTRENKKLRIELERLKTKLRMMEEEEEESEIYKPTHAKRTSFANILSPPKALKQRAQPKILNTSVGHEVLRPKEVPMVPQAIVKRPPVLQQENQFPAPQGGQFIQSPMVHQWKESVVTNGNFMEPRRIMHPAQQNIQPEVPIQNHGIELVRDLKNTTYDQGQRQVGNVIRNQMPLQQSPPFEFQNFNIVRNSFEMMPTNGGEKLPNSIQYIPNTMRTMPAQISSPQSSAFQRHPQQVSYNPSQRQLL